MLYHLNTYQTNRRLKKNDAEIRTRGTRGREVHACYLGKVSPGIEEITFGVRICCWVYVYSSGGRRSEANRYEQKIDKMKRTRPYVVGLL